MLDRVLNRLMVTTLLITLQETFMRPHLDYENIIYDKTFTPLVRTFATNT